MIALLDNYFFMRFSAPKKFLLLKKYYYTHTHLVAI